MIAQSTSKVEIFLGSESAQATASLRAIDENTHRCQQSREVEKSERVV